MDSGIFLRRTGARGIAEARLKNGTDAYSGLGSLVQDVIRAFDGGVERLFDHEMFAGADRHPCRVLKSVTR